MLIITTILMGLMPGKIPHAAQARPYVLKNKQTISRSAFVSPATYRFTNSSEDLSGASIQIKGNNITVDFRDAVLEGTPQTAEPNARKGTGLLVTGKNITIKNLKIRGYKIGLAALRSP